MRRIWYLAAALALLAPASSISFGQAPPKPGPQFDVLKSMEGTWDATVKTGGQESHGTMVFKMGLGGLWLTSSFNGDFGGQKFEGRGMDSYDANKKKYVSVWTDSMSTSPMVTEGTYDPATKKLTMEGTMPGMDGKPNKVKMVSEYKDKDTIIDTMETVGADGKQEMAMTIVYKRAKGGKTFELKQGVIDR